LSPSAIRGLDNPHPSVYDTNAGNNNNNLMVSNKDSLVSRRLVYTGTLSSGEGVGVHPATPQQHQQQEHLPGPPTFESLPAPPSFLAPQQQHHEAPAGFNAAPSGPSSTTSSPRTERGVGAVMADRMERIEPNQAFVQQAAAAPMAAQVPPMMGAQGSPHGHGMGNSAPLVSGPAHSTTTTTTTGNNFTTTSSSPKIGRSSPRMTATSEASPVIGSSAFTANHSPQPQSSAFAQHSPQIIAAAPMPATMAPPLPSQQVVTAETTTAAVVVPAATTTTAETLPAHATAAAIASAEADPEFMNRHDAEGKEKHGHCKCSIM
jgi:hypothetical protein